jgi:hypothetical protein
VPGPTTSGRCRWRRGRSGTVGSPRWRRGPGCPGRHQAGPARGRPRPVVRQGHHPARQPRPGRRWVQRPAALAAAGRAGRGAQRDVAGVGRPRGGDQDVGDGRWLVAVSAKPLRLVVDHHGECSKGVADRDAWVSVWWAAGEESALIYQRGFLDLVDRPLLVAVLDPAGAAAGAGGDRVQTEADGDHGRSAQRAACIREAATARARTPARSNTRSAALISSRGPVIASNPDLGSMPRSGVLACPPAPFPRGQAAD